MNPGRVPPVPRALDMNPVDARHVAGLDYLDGIDILVNVAGIVAQGKVEEIDETVLVEICIAGVADTVRG